MRYSAVLLEPQVVVVQIMSAQHVSFSHGFPVDDNIIGEYAEKKSGKSVVFCQQACIKVFGAWDPKKVPGNVRNECA